VQFVVHVCTTVQLCALKRDLVRVVERAHALTASATDTVTL